MTTIREATTLTAAESTEGTGRYRVRVIDAGMGSSGYYPAETLEAAGRAQVVAEGTHVFFDHPSESEEYDRPERSVRDLAAVFTSAGTYDPTTKALEGDIQVFGPYQPLMADKEFREAIGMSIRAFARVEEGEIDGKRVPVVKELQTVESVDLVTRAGRGGKILSVLESAGSSIAERAQRRVVERAVRRGLAEATANDTREQLQHALRDAYGGEKNWVWVRDFDSGLVWFEHETPDGSGLWQQTYSSEGDVIALTGTRVEVRIQTSYVPVQQATQVTTAPAAEGATSPTHIPPVAPAGSNPQESEEDTMPQIEEARLRQLEEAAGRVQTLESERDAAVQRATDAEAALAEANTRSTARPVVARVVAESTTIPAALQGSVVESVLTGLPAGADEAAVRAAAEAARTAKETEVATILEARGIGSVTGFGGGTTGDGASVADEDAAVAEAFGRTIPQGA